MYKKSDVFFSACIGMLLFGIGLITLGSVASDLKSRFSFDGLEAGMLFSILPVGILVGSLLFGRLADKYGYKIVLITSCIGMFLGFEGIAFASSFDLLKVCIFIFGVCGGSINGATNALVSDISTENKGANLSLLGVFFGIGALGMPLLLGVLESRFKVYQVVAGIGLLTLGVGIFYLFVRFPLAKEQQGLTEIKSLPFFRNSFLILIAFFLFCQSGFEAIINNWTTTYLTVIQSSTESNALYALSLHIAGMIVMRILIGTAFRSMSQVTIMWVSLILLLLGTLMLQVGLSFTLSVAGLVLLGAGVAAGFPVMLGFVGDVYFARSGAAFSFVMVIALIGNMLINYFTGVIVKDYGVQHLTTVSYAVVITMMVLCIFIFKRLNSK